MFKLIKLLLCILGFITATSLQAQLYMGNGDTLFISPAEQIYINGNMDIQQGATIINNAAAGIDLRGTAAINGEIDYSASADQNILPYNHKALRIGGSGNKMLTSNLSISNYLQLGGTAKLITNSFLLSLTGNSSSIIDAAPFGNNANSWIVTGNGNAGAGNTGLGGVKISGIGASGRNGDILFPVGPTAAAYNPLTLSNTETTDDFTVAVSDQVVPGASLSKSVRNTWQISEAIPGGSNVQLGTQWNLADEAASFVRAASGIVRSNGTIINYHAEVAAAAGFNPYTRTGTGFTSFSPFGVTSDLVVLPVTFISLFAYLHDASIQVEWAVAAASGISYYEVQKANASGVFSGIGSIAAETASGNTNRYIFPDMQPVEGANFYRVRSVGVNGAIKYSLIVKVEYAAKKSGITSYPNPVTDNKLTVEFTNKVPGMYTINILNGLGAAVYQTKLLHSGASMKYSLLLPKSLARELYQMTIDGPDGSRTSTRLMIHD